MRLRTTAALLLSVASLLATESAEALLRQVDRLRYPWPSFSVETQIRAGKTTQQWLVRVRENGDTRVEGLSEKEKGRTVLLLGDEMWLLLPNAKNPVKVSPQQRLLGPAAGCDIARFRLSEDYKPIRDTEENLGALPCRRIELQAQRPALSYRTATLWVANGKPIKAEFFLPSGKLARTLQFGSIQTARGLAVISSMTFKEPSGQEAELAFSNWKPAPSEASLFQLPTRKP